MEEKEETSADWGRLMMAAREGPSSLLQSGASCAAAKLAARDSAAKFALTIYSTSCGHQARVGEEKVVARWKLRRVWAAASRGAARTSAESREGPERRARRRA